MTRQEIEKQFILAVLHKHGGRRKETCAELGIGQRTLCIKLREWGVPPRQPGPPVTIDLRVYAPGDSTSTLIMPESLQGPQLY